MKNRILSTLNNLNVEDVSLSKLEQRVEYTIAAGFALMAWCEEATTCENDRSCEYDSGCDVVGCEEAKRCEEICEYDCEEVIQCEEICEYNQCEYDCEEVWV